MAQNIRRGVLDRKAETLCAVNDPSQCFVHSAVGLHAHHTLRLVHLGGLVTAETVGGHTATVRL